MNTKQLFRSVSFLGLLFAVILLFNTVAVHADEICEAGVSRIEFVSWDSFGVVHMQYVNGGTAPMRLTDFNIIWGNIVTRANLQLGVLTLNQVKVGGSSVTDPLATRVWVAPAGQDTESPTNGRGEGAWLTDYIFAPNSTIPIFIDFNGTSTNLQAAFGAQLSDFNGTTFAINPDCEGSVTPITDGRLNIGWGDHFAVIYPTEGAGNPALRVYRVGDNSEGWLALALEVEDFPEPIRENNQLVASQNGVAVYVLTTGEIQVVVGPDEEGKSFITILDGLPYTYSYYIDKNYYTSP